MPLTLDFAGTVDGDKLSGSVKAGALRFLPLHRQPRPPDMPHRPLGGPVLIEKAAADNIAAAFCFGSSDLTIHREGYPFIALFAAVNLLAFLLAGLAGLAAAADHAVVHRLLPRSRTHHAGGTRT